jgi:E3 ubiquitin-protein ligase makorin
MYGLLNGCDCKFCLDCIRNWRREGINVARENEQVRLCPLCRKESYFVVPSIRYVASGEEKDIIVTAYKESLQRIPCKLLMKGECSFGSSCFYYHDPVLQQARRRRNKLADFIIDDLLSRVQS